MRKYRLFLYDSFNDWRVADCVFDFKSFNNESALTFAIRVFKETEYMGFALYEIFLDGSKLTYEVAHFPEWFQED